MKHKERKNASLKTCVMLDAMICAYHEGNTFTVEGFARRYNYPVNRHLRSALRSMVKSGYLTCHKTLFDDGHYRQQFAAQKTALIWGK